MAERRLPNERVDIGVLQQGGERVTPTLGAGCPGQAASGSGVIERCANSLQPGCAGVAPHGAVKAGDGTPVEWFVASGLGGSGAAPNGGSKSSTVLVGEGQGGWLGLVAKHDRPRSAVADDMAKHRRDFRNERDKPLTARLRVGPSSGRLRTWSQPLARSTSSIKSRISSPGRSPSLANKKCTPKLQGSAAVKKASSVARSNTNTGLALSTWVRLLPRPANGLSV